MLTFIQEILKGDINDKDYQKQIIDHLVSQVFVSDDDTVVYFNIRGGKDIETLTIDDTKEAVKKVQTQSPLASQTRTDRHLPVRSDFYEKTDERFELRATPTGGKTVLWTVFSDDRRYLQSIGLNFRICFVNIKRKISLPQPFRRFLMRKALKTAFFVRCNTIFRP